MFDFPNYDEATGPHDPSELQFRHPFCEIPKPQVCVAPELPRKSIAQRRGEGAVRLVREGSKARWLRCPLMSVLSTLRNPIVLCFERCPDNPNKGGSI